MLLTRREEENAQQDGAAWEDIGRETHCVILSFENRSNNETKEAADEFGLVVLQRGEVFRVP